MLAESADRMVREDRESDARPGEESSDRMVREHPGVSHRESVGDALDVVLADRLQGKRIRIDAGQRLADRRSLDAGDQPRRDRPGSRHGLEGHVPSLADATSDRSSLPIDGDLRDSPDGTSCILGFGRHGRADGWTSGTGGA